MDSERIACLTLNAADPFRGSLWQRLVEQHGSAEALLRLPEAEWMREAALGPKGFGRFFGILREFHGAQEWEEAQKKDVRVLVSQDADYPQTLLHLPDPPLVLYVWGDATLLSGPRLLAMVGTRRPTAYGTRSARRLVWDAVREGWTTVSGLARGIDSQVHCATLEKGGKTIAVLGSGLLEVYPPENRSLAEKIVLGGGAVVSQFALRTSPKPENFPKRNQVIAGLSEATTVIEGGLRSGALITARLAAEQGKSVFALPGPVDSEMSEASHFLIQQGACLLQRFEDISQELGMSSKPSVPRPPTVGPQAGPQRHVEPALPDRSRVPQAGPQGRVEPGGTVAEKRLLELLEEPLSLEELVSQAKFSVAQVARALLELELAEKIVTLPGQIYAKR
ncbi:MAG: DNA-protecting protein DprA [Elusimicrobia bacterium]|nr:DNA-protecting protein DprA [Elusimicrobiota bacterium]